MVESMPQWGGTINPWRPCSKKLSRARSNALLPIRRKAFLGGRCFGIGASGKWGTNAFNRRRRFGRNPKRGLACCHGAAAQVRVGFFERHGGMVLRMDGFAEVLKREAPPIRPRLRYRHGRAALMPVLWRLCMRWRQGGSMSKSNETWGASLWTSCFN